MNGGAARGKSSFSFSLTAVYGFRFGGRALPSGTVAVMTQENAGDAVGAGRRIKRAVGSFFRLPAALSSFCPGIMRFSRREAS